jgi:hypothetical protein
VDLGERRRVEMGAVQRAGRNRMAGRFLKMRMAWRMRGEM